MKSVVLDARRMNTPAQAHLYLRERLQLPDYYGGNLDALYDCLTEMDSREILFIHTGEGSEYFRLIRRVFADAERHNDTLYVTDLAE